MSGSWEIKQSKTMLIGILHVDTTTIAWAFGLRNLIVPGQIMPVTGMPYDMSRNTVCKYGLDNGYEYIGFLDSDVIPQRDAFLRLMSRGKPFISGVYYRRSPPHGLPVMIRNGKWIQEFPQNSLIEVDLVGAGLLLIHRSVLEQLPPQRPGAPWFDWRVNQVGILPPGECLSEDFTLCKAVREKLGIPVIVDTSVQAYHVGFAQATLGQMTPAEVRVNT